MADKIITRLFDSLVDCYVVVQLAENSIKARYSEPHLTRNLGSISRKMT